MSVDIEKLDHGRAAVPDAAIADLRRAVAGAVALPGEPGYDEARTLWNAMVDRRPALVVRAASAEDVVAALAFARAHDLLLGVRSGGHQIAGLAVADGAMLLDLSPLRAVTVDAGRRVARVEPGATLGEIDAATQAHGLALPTGINSTTGIAGLTLGGGFGWISRRYGLTIDNLRAAELVTADGARLRASAEENPDLFWAIRGGGGNFGVVTAFEFDLHPVGPEVTAGLIVHPFDAGLLRDFDRLARAAPDGLTIWTVMRQAPPLPFLPEDWHGRAVLVLAVCYIEPSPEGDAVLAELRGLGAPIADVVGPTPFTGWQAAFDPLLTPGARNYWKSHDVGAISDGMIAAIDQAIRALPGPQCEIFFGTVGGAANRVAPEATAFPQRAAHYAMNVHTRWDDPAEDAACVAWARALYEAAAPHALGSVYVNFIPDDEAGRLGEAYGGNLERLARIKARYDPENRFRLNHNIAPAPAERPVPHAVG
ncbi:MAG: FAD-linked oxidase [Rhodovulum sulfidophilum]|uniref:FAD-linked oxidase n=1 Tax=Rhodovulum sulfidophilum TaxID=35806 RepID=A0A2W5N2B6_RHOSU|nr:MAG: FAD-linked oxidase [Rhodovulum sulfidophilum]